MKIYIFGINELKYRKFLINFGTLKPTEQWKGTALKILYVAQHTICSTSLNLSNAMKTSTSFNKER